MSAASAASARDYIVAIGGANMDVVGRADHPLMARDSTPGRIRSSPGGVARNVAENLARLGHAVRLMSAVGDDASGRTLLQATRDAGVDVSACRVLSGASTSSYLAVHSVDGELAVAMNDMRVLDRVDLHWLREHAQLVRQARALVLDCNLSDAALEWLFARRGDVPVFVDTVSAFKCTRIVPWLSRVQLLKPNRLEAEALSGLQLRSAHDAPAVAARLHAQGVAQVVISLGEQGVYWSDGQGGRGLQAAPKVPIVNANGAGDALMAGLLHGWLAAQTLPQALRFATGCAAMTLSSEWANPPQLSVATVEHLLGTLEL